MSDLDRKNYNHKIIEEFRANQGQVQGWAPLMLLTTRGARSGQTRVYPLMAVAYGEHFLAIASKGGAPTHPQWYYNLLAHPRVTVEVGADTLPVNARLLAGEERQQAFARAAEIFPPYAEYQQKTSREIPVFLLERQQA
ncbi:MAG TPA: nitroreductase family deazaflavin-dependent oxidoreductase [Ktedonobacteraceae bacterium]|jgi:deazaflavin-dependent oxidoreductase (nitroreductase family)